MNDTYRHKGLRKKLVEEIKRKGIDDKAILTAIEKIPRHLFIDSSFLQFAYQDNPFPIGHGQTISQPYTVAFQTWLLKVKRGDKIMEVGTGSGYQACVLLELGAKVFTVERIKALFDKVKVFLPSIGYEPRFFFGDGYQGLPTFAPFDKIIVTAGAPSIPTALIRQLKVGGILVIPVGKNDVQVMTSVTKTSETTYETKECGMFRFVPLLYDKEK
ncbi:MAG: protein-L-isoaspartate(D-aspartate) O-methyltransferase [Bacteroidales bacterium]|nr:protein-L-isoaspartate(D-aspartate) O-methyltransferase [Bacteroidales bacterium]